MLTCYFSNNLDIYDYVRKLPEQHFSVWLYSNPGDKTLFMKPGSLSGTYLNKAIMAVFFLIFFSGVKTLSQALTVMSFIQTNLDPLDLSS